MIIGKVNNINVESRSYASDAKGNVKVRASPSLYKDWKRDFIQENGKLSWLYKVTEDPSLDGYRAVTDPK